VLRGSTAYESIPVILAEPAPSQGDVHFRVWGIPVRVHPFFWIVALVMGLQGNREDGTPPMEVLVWIVAVFCSILVHEMGHALLQRRYGGNPRITLYGMGGLAACDDCDRSTRSHILICLAGPCAGFLLALMLMILVNAVGHHGGWTLLGGRPQGEIAGIKVLGTVLYWSPFPSENVNRMISHLLFINVLWGAVNLLPIYPLDGGQISREICLLGQPRQGMILSLRISVVAAAAMALVGLSWGSFLIVIFFGYLSYSSYRALESYQKSIW